MSGRRDPGGEHVGAPGGTPTVWVVDASDPCYPDRLRIRLGDRAPGRLWGVGPRELLARGGLAVVGSRDASAEALEYAARAGQLCAAAGVPVISGGARGVDQAALLGALEDGGVGVAVLPGELRKAAGHRRWRSYVDGNRLVLVSAVPPDNRFQVWRAMERNKYIYGLADAALVVECTRGKGGTWAGATEQLEKLRFVPVFVPRTAADSSSEGLAALVEKGALTWHNPRTAEGLRGLLQRAADSWDQETGADARGAPPKPRCDSKQPKQLPLPGFDGD